MPQELTLHPFNIKMKTCPHIASSLMCGKRLNNIHFDDFFAALKEAHIQLKKPMAIEMLNIQAELITVRRLYYEESRTGISALPNQYMEAALKFYQSSRPFHLVVEKNDYFWFREKLNN